MWSCRSRSTPAWWHQTITWNNVDLLSVRSSNNQLRALSQEIPQPSLDTQLKCLRLPEILGEDDETTVMRYVTLLDLTRIQQETNFTETKLPHTSYYFWNTLTVPDSKVHVANMGPIKIANNRTPWTLLSGDVLTTIAVCQKAVSCYWKQMPNKFQGLGFLGFYVVDRKAIASGKSLNLVLTGHWGCISWVYEFSEPWVCFFSIIKEIFSERANLW